MSLPIIMFNSQLVATCRVVFKKQLYDDCIDDLNIPVRIDNSITWTVEEEN
ncbi:hypothetical protein GCM10022210_12340 [Mucilaginibacter dorajii]|uniref:Uncharacterized protein n=1 Tax=Mucilaginibacter dorajii TaxID=692994 RepID=A0ABP7PH98_9SPHI